MVSVGMEIAVHDRRRGRATGVQDAAGGTGRDDDGDEGGSAAMREQARSDRPTSDAFGLAACGLMVERWAPGAQRQGSDCET